MLEEVELSITYYEYAFLEKKEEIVFSCGFAEGIKTDTYLTLIIDILNYRKASGINRLRFPHIQSDECLNDVIFVIGEIKGRGATDNLWGHDGGKCDRIRLNKNVVNHYNALNQLTQTLTKNYKVRFTYDVEDAYQQECEWGENGLCVGGDQLVMELSDSGKVQKRYIRGNDLAYSDKGTGAEKQYYVTDSHGNVVQLTDESGKVVKTYEYDSFGNEVKPEKKDENPFRYCGEYYDKEIGEIYLRARYYQPAVGRFLTRDTYTGMMDEPLSLHLYTYCENDVINRIDPKGHDCYVFSLNEFKRESEGIKKIVKKHYKKRLI